MNVWRFIESPPTDIFTQMALDRELFEEFVQHLSLPPLLRIFRVSEPAVTVGRLFRIRTVSSDLPVCVRPTGGGLVRHGQDLVYSVCARRDSFPTFGMVRTSYLSFHEAVQDAFSVLGFETRLLRCDEVRPLTQPSPPKGGEGQLAECFKEPVATDVLLEERKIAGGGQWRRERSFLHQGSVQIPPGVSYEDLRDALKKAFAKKFGIDW